MATKNLNKNSYFYGYKAWKNKSGSYLNLYNAIIFNFKSAISKNQIRAMISFRIISILYSSQNLNINSKYLLWSIHLAFLANIKSLANISIPADVQNNYIKLSGFRFNKTRLLHQGNDEKPCWHIQSSSTPKILSQFFITNFCEFFQYFLWKQPFLWKDRDLTTG